MKNSIRVYRHLGYLIDKDNGAWRITHNSNLYPIASAKTLKDAKATASKLLIQAFKDSVLERERFLAEIAQWERVTADATRQAVARRIIP